jgi:GTP cyclohydrolase I
VKFNQRKMAKGAQLLLEGMGVDPKDPNFRRTPQRVARLYVEILSPRRRMRDKEVTFPSSSGPDEANEMIVLRHHKVVGLCPHHLLPIEYDVCVGYIPDGKVLGLSKLARVVDAALTEPIMQEDLTARICSRMYQITQPKGVAVRVVGVHGCMKFRGVKSTADTVTQALRGVFLLNATTRTEWSDLVGGR